MSDHDPVPLVHRQTTVASLRYDGTEARRNAIIGWSQGKCFTTNGEITEFWCDSPNGRRPIYTDMTVICGVLGEWYAISAATVAANYDAPTDYGCDFSLSDQSVRLLRTTAHETTDVERLRELVDLAVAAALERSVG